MKTAIKIVSLLFVILLSIGILLYNGVIWFVYPNNKYPKGIDISHHQGEIKWELLKKSDLSFIFMKATEGDDFVDKQFIDNWRNADTLKIKKGAYHFYSLRFSGKEQALNYINIVPNEKNILPPVIDLEYGGNSFNKSKNDRTTNNIPNPQNTTNNISFDFTGPPVLSSH